MSNPKSTTVTSHQSARQRRRRPTGLSRRRKQLNLSFETLEDRRVMSANSPIDPQLMDLLANLQANSVSYSSATPEGQLALLQQEIARYAASSGDVHSDVVLNSFPTDPLLSDQWHLINSGQQVGSPDFQVIFGTPGEDINVAPVWNMGITGEGVVVAVIDSGTEIDHPDLFANIDPSFQFDAIDNDFDASPQLLEFIPLNAHGTATAGLIGATSNNGEGGTGVAPGAQLVPIRLIDLGQTIDSFVNAFRFRTDEIDITNNSWGPAVIRGVAGPTPQELFALRDSVVGVNAGRDGLGIIHVFSAGNDAGVGSLDSASYNGWVNSRYTIGVTGVDHDGFYNNVDGTVTDYPETGASVLVAAPTGSVFLTVGDDLGIGSGLLTTDTTGNTGFNQDPDPDTGEEFDRDFLEDEAYTSRFNGTSAAAPLVSGVIALMLEANPNLSWRDVQEILVRSSRQNAEFDTQADGFDKTFGVEYQSTWIVNQVPLFHEPDEYDPLIPNFTQFYAPTLNPFDGNIFLNAHNAPTPQVLTNGAGYTVSQGRGTNNDQIGFAHGVVDAELAVQLAQQWSTKGQGLPDELSFTTTVNNIIPSAGINSSIPAAFVVDPGGIDMIIPGFLGAGNNWQGYYSEYFAPVPNFAPFAAATHGGPIELTVPQIDGQDIVVEHVEVVLDIGGAANAASDALDNLRVVLVSPNGTHSELNHYFVDPSFAPVNTHQIEGFFNPITGDPLLAPNGENGVSEEAHDRLDPTPPTAGNLQFTFSTNRSWGERTDDAILFDPTTNEPFATLPGLGGNIYSGTGIFGGPSSVGDLISQGWQLHFENYGNTDLNLNSVEVIWHGSPVSANTQRIQGLIGVDDNRDDLFNYSRVIQQTVNILGDDPSQFRLGEVQNIIDPNHESMGANITVLAYHDVNANGIIDATDLLVDQFVTGADGNYFFDLVPDDYIIALDADSLGSLTPLDDSLSQAGILKDYQPQWAIGAEFFQVWDYDANLDVPIDPVTNAPFPFLDGSGNTVEYHVNHINFLLDPGAPAAPQVTFTGHVIADLDGDGIFNGADTVAPGILVFGDVNRNGQFDSGEAFTSTDVNGNYSLTVPSAVTAVINVGVQTPVDWSFSAPDDGILEFFTRPGDTISGVDFALQPPSGAGQGNPGSSLPGTILGFVFEDSNEDRVRQASEAGISNVEVYIDNNQSGELDAGDTVTTTNSNGAYVFTNVPVGIHELRVDLNTDATLVQTFPVFGLPHSVTIVGEATVSDIAFGFNNTATLDYGDLPDQYFTLFDGAVHSDEEGGARHPKGIFFLGQSVDAELNGQPTVDANGDDLAGVNDEDGIFVDPLVAGAIGRVEAIASRHGGYLQAWIDYNGDGDFDDVIDGVSERIITNELLDPGSNILSFAIPDTIEASTVYARFRYGEFGLGLMGLADVGEVEDYVLDKAAPVAAVHGPDFNEDGMVNGGDFLAWQRGFGLQTNALPGNGDANDDGGVDATDLAMIMHDYGGQTSGNYAAIQAPGDSEENSGAAPLAAIAAPLVSSELTDGTTDGSTHTQVTTLGPRMTQPGFHEDLGAGVIDTNHSSTTVTSGAVASIASELRRMADAAPRKDSPFVMRQEASFEGDSSRDVSGSDVRDRVFAGRRHRADRFDAKRLEDVDEAEALAVALSEDIDWRLM